MKLLAATIIFSAVFVTVEAKGTRNGEMLQNYKPQELLGLDLDLDLPPVQQQLRQAEDWTAALKYVASKGTDRSLQEEEEEEDDDDTTPPQPYLPNKFTFTGDITQSGVGK